MTSVVAIFVLGFVLGMRHATDADHVMAVTTIVSQERSVRAAGVIGAVWGAGHTLTILLVGGAIILFDVVVPPRVGLAMELAVAVMLVVLGALNLSAGRARSDEGARRPRGADEVSPAGIASARSGLRGTQLARSLVVGVVHGLAGSAAVALLVLTTIHDPRFALLYLLLFGAGTLLGMILLTSMIALPFALAAERSARINRRMVQVTSLLSIGLGLFLAYQCGVADGLFTPAPSWTPR